MVWEYAVLMVPPGSGDVVVTARVGVMVSAIDLVVIAPAVSATCTVKFEVPAVVGVPLSTPVLLRETPAGKDPVLTDQVCEPVPPVAVKVCEYAVPTVPLGMVEALLIAMAAATVRDSVLVMVAPAASVSRMIGLLTCAAVGVPLKTPALLKFRPGA